ncbi:helix-turn-helix domain-containing protein [Streptomyces sp. NPDC002125]
MKLPLDREHLETSSPGCPARSCSELRSHLRAGPPEHRSALRPRHGRSAAATPTTPDHRARAATPADPLHSRPWAHPDAPAIPGAARGPPHSPFSDITHSSSVAVRRRSRIVGHGCVVGNGWRRCEAPHGFVDRLSATLVHLRQGVPHDAAACWFGVDRSTVTQPSARCGHLGAQTGGRVVTSLHRTASARGSPELDCAVCAISTADVAVRRSARSAQRLALG